MSIYHVTYFIGCFIASFFLAGILYLCTRSWPGRYGKAFFVHSIAAIIAVLLSAIGNADGGPPNFSTAGYYLLSQAVLLVADFARLRGRGVRVTEAAEEDQGREWSAADQEEFKRLLDKQRR
jgi:hypothetical protein